MLWQSQIKSHIDTFMTAVQSDLCVLKPLVPELEISSIDDNLEVRSPLVLHPHTGLDVLVPFGWHIQEEPTLTLTSIVLQGLKQFRWQMSETSNDVNTNFVFGLNFPALSLLACFNVFQRCSRGTETLVINLSGSMATSVQQAEITAVFGVTNRDSIALSTANFSADMHMLHVELSVNSFSPAKIALFNKAIKQAVVRAYLDQELGRKLSESEWVKQRLSLLLEQALQNGEE